MASGNTERANFLAIDGTGIRFSHGGKKKAQILQGIDIHVNVGTIYGLLGPSGCGKTTLLKCVVGHWKPKCGCIKIFGQKPGESGFCIPGRGVGYMPQELALYTEFTIEETLTYFGRLSLMAYELIDSRIEFLLQFLDISNKTKTVGNLSGGQQRRVSLAAALIHKPPLLILDEPTVGVDPLLRQSIWAHLETLASTEQMTIVITTHYVEEARRAHTIGLMRKGRLLAEMNPESLMKKYNSPTLEDVFLKLCKKDSEVQNLKEGNRHHSSPDTEEQADEYHFSEVWVSREKKCYSLSGNTDLSRHKALFSYPPLPGEHPTFSSRAEETGVRMITLIKKGVTRMKRNIPFTCFQIFIPLIQVMVFCFCIGGEIFDLKVSVVNMEDDAHGFGRRFLNSLDNNTILQRPQPNISLALESVRNGNAWGAVYIGPRFTECLFDRFLESSDANNRTIDCSKVKLYLDMTSPQISITIYASLMKSFQIFAAEALKETFGNPHLAESPVSLEDFIYGSEDTKLAEFMAPGVIVGITYFMAMALTGIIIISEKKEGLLDRSWMAGVTHGEVLFSIMFVFFFVMVLQAALVMIFIFVAFSVPIHGSIFWAIFCVLLAGLNGMANGIFISTICSNESAALMVSMGSFLPNFLASGILWPLEAMGYWLRYATLCLPLTLIANTMRSIVSRGWDVSENHIWDGFIVSLIWMLFFLLVSWLMFRYRK